jgi:hypothetical protein
MTTASRFMPYMQSERHPNTYVAAQDEDDIFIPDEDAPLFCFDDKSFPVLPEIL